MGHSEYDNKLGPAAARDLPAEAVRRALAEVVLNVLLYVESAGSSLHHLRFCAAEGTDPLLARADTIAAWIRNMLDRTLRRPSKAPLAETGLANATIQQRPGPLTLSDLQQWLGHKHPASTRYYAATLQRTLTAAYKKADYFARNVRTIQVLIDRESILTGAATGGEQPWKYYDLGEGYCSYDFFVPGPRQIARCWATLCRLMKVGFAALAMSMTGDLAAQPASTVCATTPCARRAWSGRTPQ